MSKKKQKKASSPIRVGVWIFLIMIFTVELLIYAWCRVQHTHIGYKIANERVTQERLLSLQKKIGVEVAHLKSQERFAQIAKRLDLKTPTADQILTLP